MIRVKMNSPNHYLRSQKFDRHLIIHSSYVKCHSINDLLVSGLEFVVLSTGI